MYTDPSTTPKSDTHAVLNADPAPDLTGIEIKLENHIVRVKNDDVLKHYLRARRGNAGRLAAHIQELYQTEFGYPLHISKRSLSVELTMHFWVQQVFLFKDRLTQKVFHRRIFARFSDMILLHMDVIDCGERYEDSNRIVWDLMSFTVPRRKKKSRDK